MRPREGWRLERGVRLGLHLPCPGFSPQEEEGRQHLLPVSWERTTVGEMHPGCSEEVSSLCLATPPHWASRVCSLLT